MNLVGLNFCENGIEFVPRKTELTDEINLYYLKYRNSILNIKISGNGENIKSFKINGIDNEPFIDSKLCGLQNIEIELM